MDWSYIAGYFDADGNLHILQNKIKKNYQLLIRIYSSNIDSLNKIKEFTKLGNIYHKKKETLNRSDVYELTISKKEDCFMFLKNIKQHSIIRKNQIDYLLKNFNFKRFSNKVFDLEKFRSYIQRKNVNNLRKTKNFK